MVNKATTPIQRYPLTTAEVEAQAVLAVNMTGGVRIASKSAPTNNVGSAGTQVGGQIGISGGSGGAPQGGGVQLS